MYQMGSGAVRAPVAGYGTVCRTNRPAGDALERSAGALASNASRSFPRPCHALAIAATDIGRDIIRVELMNDNDNPRLGLLRDGIDDDSLL